MSARSKTKSPTNGPKCVSRSSFFIRLNNFWAFPRIKRLPPENVLLLAPHCLQRQSCDRKVLADLNSCARCGACDLTGLLALRDRYQLRCLLASGGRQALQAVKAPEVRGVIAVACEPELFAGIRAAFPKPVLGIPNLRPEGPCKNTRVNLPQLEATLKTLVWSV